MLCTARPRPSISGLWWEKESLLHLPTMRVGKGQMEMVFIFTPSQTETMAGVWHAASKQGHQKKWGMKSPVFHQFNIPNIGRGQADSAHLPRKTYGIQLKGCSFSKTVSLSLNFLRRSLWPCFRLEKKKSWGTARLKKVWIQSGHCHLSPSVLFKGVFAFKNVSKPPSSLPAIFIPCLRRKLGSKSTIHLWWHGKNIPKKKKYLEMQEWKRLEKTI